MKKRREKRSIEFRQLRDNCVRQLIRVECYRPVKEVSYCRIVGVACKASNCPTWKRLKKLNYVARTKDDGAFYEVYWVKTK